MGGARSQGEASGRMERVTTLDLVVFSLSVDFFCRQHARSLRAPARSQGTLSFMLGKRRTLGFTQGQGQSTRRNTHNTTEKRGAGFFSLTRTHPLSPPARHAHRAPPTPPLKEQRGMQQQHRETGGAHPHPSVALAPEGAALRQASLAPRRLAERRRARRARHDRLGVREHGRDLEAALALDIHEVGVGRLDQAFELVPPGFEGGGRVEEVDVVGRGLGRGRGGGREGRG